MGKHSTTIVKPAKATSSRSSAFLSGHRINAPTDVGMWSDEDEPLPYEAKTPTETKRFKTAAAGRKWLEARGYDVGGHRLYWKDDAGKIYFPKSPSERRKLEAAGAVPYRDWERGRAYE